MSFTLEKQANLNAEFIWHTNENSKLKFNCTLNQTSHLTSQNYIVLRQNNKNKECFQMQKQLRELFIYITYVYMEEAISGIIKSILIVFLALLTIL